MIFKDQLGREVKLNNKPKRVVSLVPSQTEYLIDLGVDVIGRTKFCIHPKEEVNEIPIVGGTKKVHFDRVKKLNPDLIIANKEENNKEDIDRLGLEFPIWISDVTSISDSIQMMSDLGEICDREEESNLLIQDYKKSLEIAHSSHEVSVVYFIWKDPWMVSGNDTFIHDMLNHVGYSNLITQQRYPEITREQVLALNPDKLLFSSEPYPFKDSLIPELEKTFPNIPIEIVDGEFYSWYGSRLVHLLKS